ncbi:MAG: tetratricopeptide repeat protein, partial [Bacteroidetes bacterium]
MGRFSISCLTLWIAISGLSAQTRVLDSLELKLSQVKDDSNKAQLLNTLALNLWTTDSVRAKNLFTEAQTLADKLGNGSLQFDLWMANAKWYYDHKDYNRSLEYTVQARTKAGELEDAARLSEALLLMGNIFNEMEEKDRAIDFTKQALEAARRSGDRKRQFGVLNYLGKLHMWTTRFDEAEEYFVLAMDLARELGNKKYQAGILHNLGNNASDANQNDKAIDFYQQSLKLKREMGDVEGECNMLSLIAYHYKQKSNFPLSLEYYQKARDLARESPHNISVHIIIEEGIGKVYESMGNHEMALVHFQDGLNQARLADHFTFQIMLLSDIGDNYVLQEKYDTALAYFFSILPIIQNKKHAALSLAKVNNHLGNTYEKLGQLDSAGIYLQEAL